MSYNNLEDILSSNVKTQQKCLDKLVEDIHEVKERTIYNFLKDSGSEDYLWSLVNLLSSKDIRISSNAAYVIGSLAETELGTSRVLSLTQGNRAASIIQDLTNALTSDDAEYVMNAAGTLGTLAETTEGREWMLGQVCIDDTLSSITDLLSYENNWVASNAALVLARLTISEAGCTQVLKHEKSSHILTRLILSLGNDAAGRGMNAAFAIGRLLDTDQGKKRLLNLPETEKMISSLCRMLCKGDMGSAKNACFAVSCLAADADGNHRVLSNGSFNDVLTRLVSLLANDEDVEAAWFSAMTLRTLSSHHNGVLKLRNTESVISALNKNLNKPNNTKELNEEIVTTLEHLKRLEAPTQPVVNEVSSTSIQFKWAKLDTSSEMIITYKLFEGAKAVYKGKDTVTKIDNLSPNTTYHFKLRLSAIGDESPFSETITVTTEEGLPTAPTCLHVVGSTPNQVRVVWNRPEHPNGTLRGYSVFLGEKLMDCINETSFIFGRLQPSTSYTIHVCASTSKGLGERATLSAHTEELGAHAPGKPSVTVIGRNEAHVVWNPPEVPLGRFFRFELAANKEVIYSGTDRSFRATNLIPDTDYSFTVCAITSEGRCESEPTKKRTHKDKSQVEPGRHASKTQSSIQKEYQLEKAKTHSTIVRQKKKIKNKGARPNSCISSLSGKSRKLDVKPVPSSDGSWANDRPTTVSTDTTDTSDSKSNPSLRYNTSGNNAVLGGLMMKVDAKPAVNGKGNHSLFLQKSKSEYPLRHKLTDKNMSNQKKLLVEPITLEEMLSADNNQPFALPTRKQTLPKPRSKNVPKPLENEKSFIRLITQSNNLNSNLPKMTLIDHNYRRNRSSVLASNTQGEVFRPRKEKLPISRVRKRMSRRQKPSASTDSSSDELRATERHTRENKPKIEPLKLEDVVAQNHLTPKPMKHRTNFDDPKFIVARIKASNSSKGYYSDHDAYPSTRKKANELAPINYNIFRGAHRPSKSFRQESPSPGDPWLMRNAEKNKQNFMPTQLRTQPQHLPNQVSGRHSHRLDALTQLDLRRGFSKRLVNSSYSHNTEPTFQRSFESVLPTRSYLLRNGSRLQPGHSHNADINPHLLQDRQSSPHQGLAMTHGDAV